MVTTIQLREDVKLVLDKMKSDSNKTYEDVIVKMIHDLEEQKRRQKQLLILGCREMANDSLKIIKEFEHTDSELDIEW